MALTLAARRVDGLIVVPASQSRGGLLQFQRLERPIIFVDRPATVHDSDSVTVDNRAGASVAIRHLAAHGHRQIAFLGDLGTIWTAAERYVGYVEGLALSGLQLDPRLTRQDLHSIEAADRAAMELLASASPPSAFFAGQNLITIGVIRALQRMGLQHTVALVGFDDLELMDLLDPGVTVIAQDPAGLGRTAAELLFARLAGDRSAPRHVEVPTRLIVRGSGEIRA